MLLLRRHLLRAVLGRTTLVPKEVKRHRSLRELALKRLGLTTSTTSYPAEHHKTLFILIYTIVYGCIWIIMYKCGKSLCGRRAVARCILFVPEYPLERRVKSN